MINMKFKIDNKAKKILVGQQAFSKATPEDMAVLSNYTAIGYSVEVVAPKKVKGDTTTDVEIRSMLKGSELDTYEDLKKKKGFFAAKKYWQSLQK